MKTAFIHHPISQKHQTGIDHPETAKRYDAVIDAVKSDAKLLENLNEITASPASKGLILAAHSKDHFQRVEGAFEHGLHRLDQDTMVSMKTFEAALMAAGGACKGVDEVLKGESKNAFVVARPPGHHATSEQAMGFCIFNNVAVAARYAQNNFKEIDRIAIIDWDVHHGNGTQGIFFDDPSVYFYSMHQYPWYPGSGSYGENGFGRGKGYTKNIPVKAKTPAKAQLRMFESSIEELSKNFTPDLIFISAGFDGHESDPLGQLMLEDEDFISMTKTVKQWADQACSGRIISCLEGGYNLETLGETVRSHIAELAA